MNQPLIIEFLAETVALLALRKSSMPSGETTKTTNPTPGAATIG